MKDRSDESFEQFRRERQKHRARSGEFRPFVENQEALHELEQAEAKEVRDHQLTREVHEFFSEATKTAASIVQKVSDEHEEETTEKLTSEMEEFLMDAFQRMNAFVTLIKRRSNPNGPVEQILEAEMHRIVGPALDAFRQEGTAELDDKHLGQDPFETDLEADDEKEPAAPRSSARDDDSEDVEEVSAGVGAYALPEDEEDDDDIQVRPDHGPNLAGPVEDIEQHLVAELHRGDEEEVDSRDGAKDEDEDEADEADEEVDLEKLKVALRTLVRQGLMTKDEAREKYRAALGKGSASAL